MWPIAQIGKIMLIDKGYIIAIISGWFIQSDTLKGQLVVVIYGAT